MAAIYPEHVASLFFSHQHDDDDDDDGDDDYDDDYDDYVIGSQRQGITI